MDTEKKLLKIIKESKKDDKNEVDGGILILKKADGTGYQLALHNLSPNDAREALSLATYYNEKFIIESYVEGKVPYLDLTVSKN